MLRFGMKNVKGFLDTGEIEIRPLTIMIGQNSSGKSSLLRFPLVLRQTFSDESMAPLLFSGKSIDYGKYVDVVFKHDPKTQMDFEFRLPREILTSFRFARSELFANLYPGDSFDVKISIFQKDRILVRSFEISTKNNAILRIEREEQAPSYRLYFMNELLFDIPENDIDFNKFIPNFVLFFLSTTHELDKEKANVINNICSAVTYYFNTLSKSLFYIGSFRNSPERSYDFTENALNNVGKSGEHAPVILGQASKSGKSLVNSVSNWLRNSLGFSLDVEEQGGENFKIMITDLHTGMRNNLMDVGHGLSQLIPVVVQTLMDNDEASIDPFRPELPVINLIEQPELHLHPAAQAALADLFVEGVRRNHHRRKTCFLVETHSEHMLLRLRRFIVDGKLAPRDVAIYYTEKSDRDGSLRVKKLEIDEFGRIEGWPEDFFADDYVEMLALRASIRHKSQSRQSEDTLW